MAIRASVLMTTTMKPIPMRSGRGESVVPVVGMGEFAVLIVGRGVGVVGRGVGGVARGVGVRTGARGGCSGRLLFGTGSVTSGLGRFVPGSGV